VITILTNQEIVVSSVLLAPSQSQSLLQKGVIFSFFLFFRLNLDVE
jgi:hypothetical protein